MASNKSYGQNADSEYIIFDRFNGGISNGIKSGGSYIFGRGIDIHEDPSYFKPLPATVKESGTTIVDKPIGLTRDKTGVIWAVDNSDRLYKRTTGAVWSVVSNGESETQYTGIVYWDQTDLLYLPSMRGINTYGRLSGTPAFNESYRTYVDQTAAGAGQTYTLTTAVNEGATHKWPFIPAHDGIRTVVVNVVAKGTGNWTLVIHDDGNNLIASCTITNASMGTGDVEFDFSSQVRVKIGGTYHVHIYSSVADGTVRTGTANDLTDGSGNASGDISVVHDFLINTKSALHPMLVFTNFLVILNERYVSTFDGLLTAHTNDTGTLPSSWNLEALTFPAGYEAVCAATFDEYIAIGLDYKGDDNKYHSKGKIILWDGISSTYNFALDVFEGGVTTLLTINNRLFFVAGLRGEFFQYLGADYKRVRRLPKTNDQTYIRTGPQSATVYMGMPCFGFSFEHDNTEFEHGVYTWGHKDTSFIEALSYAWPISTGTRTGTGIQIGLVQAFGTELFIGWKDGSSYGIDCVKPANSPFTQVIMEGLIDDRSVQWHKKYVRTIRVDHAALAANESVLISYKIDRQSSWQDGTLNDVDGSTYTRLEVNQEYKDLQWKVTVNQTTTKPRIDSVLVHSEPRKNSELP